MHEKVTKDKLIEKFRQRVQDELNNGEYDFGDRFRYYVAYNTLTISKVGEIGQYHDIYYYSFEVYMKIFDAKLCHLIAYHFAMDVPTELIDFNIKNCVDDIIAVFDVETDKFFSYNNIEKIGDVQWQNEHIIKL